MFEDDSDDDNDDFGVILPSLIQQLKNVLSQYPDNGQIIKEIIQNAEDAGASVVKFLHDENDEGTLFSQGIEELKGPALYSYNDAYFTEVDWKGIRMLGESLKTKDPMKVGKFGLGFKSVFHLTDNPVIMSDQSLGIINPDEKFFSKDSTRRTGKFFSFDKNQPGTLSHHQDRSDTFKDVFNMDPNKGICKGTVFRFALRKKPSKLSETIYDGRRMQELFLKFKSEGHLALIFLKNLTKIEFYVRKKGASRAKLTCSFAVREGGREHLRQQEKGFMKDVKKAHDRDACKNLSLVTNLTITSRFEQYRHIEAEYFVLNYYAGDFLNRECQLTTPARAKKLGVIPLIGIAYQVQQTKSTSGHVFCALPLPILQKKVTGLPVHVNGFFALAPDRKDLKWSAADETDSNNEDVSWNLFLIEKVLPEAYKELFLHLKDKNLSAVNVYNALADMNEIDYKWQKLANGALSKVYKEKCVWSGALKRWIMVDEAYFRDKERSGCNAAECFLSLCSYPVANLPEHVIYGMKKLGLTLTLFNPKILLKAVADTSGDDKLSHMSPAERIELLNYMLEDPKDVKSLFNAPVLPLENGTFASPQHSFHTDELFITSTEHSKDLVPGGESRLIKTGLKDDLLEKLIKIANKGYCQINILNEKNVASLIKDVINAHNFGPTLKLSSSEFRKIPHSWFKLIWSYINKNGALEHYEGLPLIPLGTATYFNEIAVIRRPSLLIYNPKRGTDDVLSLLKGLGFIIVEELPAYICHNRPVFNTYIHEYTDGNIPKLLLNLSHEIGEKVLVKRFKNISNENAKLRLSHKLARIQMNSKELQLIKALPMFKNTENHLLVSVNSCGTVAPQHVPDKMPPVMLLKANDDFHRSFLTELGCRLLNKVQMIETVLLPEIERKSVLDENDDLMIKYIFDICARDERGCANVIQRLKKVQFVTSDDRKRHLASELFDPYCNLDGLFEDEAGRFPCGTFALRRLDFEVLKRLGLKQRDDVSANDIIRCLDKLCAMRNIEKAQLKALHILNILERNDSLLANRTLLAQMQSRPWIPIRKERPYAYPGCLSWFGEKKPSIYFERPSEMYFQQHANLVGCVQAIFDRNVENFYAIRYLKQNNGIDPHVVIDQLSQVVKAYTGKDKHEYFVVLNDVYRYLVNHNKKLSYEQRTYLETEKWAWGGDEFVKPEQIVLETALDLRPYISSLPEELDWLAPLLLDHGTVPELTEQHLIAVLCDIKNLHEYKQQRIQTVQRDRKICQGILEELCQMELSKEDREKILVPVRCDETKLKLVIASHTVYNADGDDDEIDEEQGKISFLHECIAEETAKALHIRSLTNKLIGAEDLEYFEEYGQSEPLTRRINRILADYGDGSAIIKELIQNADDAGAREVKFLYDERLNMDKRKHLIDHHMKDFQGPALWAYNDAKFSKEDFESIVKISGATKEEKRDKIGKFGLGFNAVYNITDVPSFISDNQLVIFDPHTTNLANAITNKAKPGVKISLGPKRDHLKRCRDQLFTYHGIFGMDASLKDSFKTFNGTLFRFPLRTEKQAQISQIKSLFYSKNEMRDLVKKFASEANRILMFTQNVLKVEFFHLEKDATSPDLIQPLLKISKDTFQPDLKSKDLRARACNSFDIMRISSQMVDRIFQRRRTLHQLNNSIQNIIDISNRVEPRAMKEFEMVGDAGKKTWILHSFIDDKQCMNMAMENSQLNPVASVAVAIAENPNGRDWILDEIGEGVKGYFFSSLPLPIPNGLNVHVNSTFALTKDRKSFQEKSQDDKKYDTLETIWNRLLMEGPVPTAYVGVLTDLTSVIRVENEDVWYSIWPRMSAVYTCKYNRELIISFYHQVIRNNVTIFPNPNVSDKWKWLNWSHIKIIEERVKDLEMREVIEDVYAALCKDHVIVHMPQELLSTIASAGFEEDLKTILLPFSEFFTTVFMPNIQHNSLKEEERDKVMIYALRESSEESAISESISINDCIPTKPFGVLKRPSNLVNPESEAADLFKIADEVFPSNEFKSSSSELSDLGMVSNRISWNLLVDRAKTVKDLGFSSPEEALKRTKKILHLIKKKRKDSKSQAASHAKSWQDIEFLPVKSKPKLWEGLIWEGEKSLNRFAPAKNMYLSRLENVVGCHKLIIDEAYTGYTNRDIEELLGIRKTATIFDVMEQTKLIYESITRCTYQHATKDDHANQLHSLFDSIYSNLSEKIETEPSLKEEIAERFVGKPVILTSDNNLVKSNQVAFKLSYDAKPYLHKPYAATKYHDILTVLNVKQEFNMEDYRDALMELKKDAGDHPITERQLGVVRNLLESIQKCMKTFPESQDEELNIVLPDREKILWPKKDVAVKETVWMRIDPKKRYLHEAIPSKLALDLGAKTARSHSIASHSRGLPFGQHEKLTVRLKRILEAYPSEIQILYELLQNADDAGASQVTFLLDKRHHSDDTVFGDSWKPLQGPALLVFNDAPFKQSDIEGIQNLGEGNKSYDSLKTGQFGIGFNVVYGLTDVPCLLTRADGDDVLCIFDPHARYLEECSENEPGRMFRNARNYLKDAFPDIYNTFLPNFFKNEQSAVFRLPLRTDSGATTSLIKNKATTISQIIQMFNTFKCGGPEAIIFLRNVSSVQFFFIEENGNQECFSSIRASVSKKAKRASELFSKDCKVLSQAIKDRSAESDENFNCVQYKLQLSTNRKDVQNWRIIQKCASVNASDLPASVNSKYYAGELPLIPAGGISCKTDGYEAEGKVYCLLPLTVVSSLPIHINGKFILDYESRRRLWYSKEEHSFQKDWNNYVIEKCIIPCYIELMITLAKEVVIRISEDPPTKTLEKVFLEEEEKKHPKEIHIYFRYFPKLSNNDKVHEYDADLVKMFYKKLNEEAVHVMPVLRVASKDLQVEFCPPNTEAKQFYLPDLSNGAMSTICLALIRTGMNIYNVPAGITRSFKASGVPLQVLSPEVVADFLRSNSPKILKGRESLQLKQSVFKDMETVNALLKYCMKPEEFGLSGIPLLVTEDECLRVFDDEQHVYYDSLSKLFPKKTNKTLHEDLRGSLRKYKDKVSGPLRKFTLDDFNEALDEELASYFKESEEIEVTNPNVLKKLPSETWLDNTWNFLRRRCVEWKTERETEERDRAKETKQEPRSLANMGVTQEAFLEPISNWCFFPVERRCGDTRAPMRYVLIKIRMACNAVDPVYDNLVKPLVNEIGLPVPSSKFTDNTSFHHKPNFQFLRQMASTKENPNAFVAALIHTYEKARSSFLRLSAKTAEDLLGFLQSSIKHLDRSRQQSLKILPVWQDLSGKLMSISSANKVFLIEEHLPKSGTAILQKKHNVLLLKKLDLERLYKWIGLRTCCMVDVYCLFILKYFDDLPSVDRDAHLSFLRDKYIVEGKLEPTLLEALKNTRIIEMDGVLSLASDFYDPEVDLFQSISTETAFPPAKYREHNWFPFLRYIGLISEVSAELYCQLAENVSMVIDTEERRCNSMALVDHLRKSDELKKDLKFLNRISEIKFLVADKLDKFITDICQVQDEECLLCFKDAIEYSQRNILLSWSVENILPSYTSQNDLLSLPYKELKVKCKVPSASVARNLKKVSKSSLLEDVVEGVKRYPTELGDRFKQIFKVAYEHFQDTNDDDALRLLCSIPVILIYNENIISVARKVTHEGGFDLHPHIFSMPMFWGQFAEFFKKIGMSERPSMHQLIKVLADLYSVTNGESLHPNEASVVTKAISHIIKRQANEVFPTDVSMLALPGVLGSDITVIRLYKSQEIVYFDDIHLEKRLTKFNRPKFYLGSPEEEEISLHNVCQFFKELPSLLRPKVLSEFITEKMLDAETLPNYGFTQELQSKMNCIEFVQCIIRLLKQEGGRDKQRLDKISDLLSKVQIITKDFIRTALHESGGLQLEDSEANKDVFVCNGDDGVLSIYIKASIDAKEKALGAVTRAIVYFLSSHGSSISSDLSPLILCLLLSDDPKTMNDFLDDEGIRRDDEEFLEQRTISFTPGAYVPNISHYMLINDLGMFDVGDVVAYEVDDPGIVDEDGDPIYMYAKILECSKEGKLKDFYKIDIGLDEPIMVHKTELFGFHRPYSSMDDDEDNATESLEEVKEVIKNELEEAFMIEEAYAKKTIKRLWLKWHPDKNPGRAEFCSEVFNCIQSEAERLRSNSSQDNNDSFWTFNTSFKRYSQKGSKFCHQRRHLASQEHSETFHSKNPQPREAARWLRQAKHDLDAARSDFTGPGYEWACFKCHQAAEKSLKAAVFMKDFSKIDHHFLGTIASKTENQLLENLANQIDSLLVGSSAMRYPDRWRFPSIPHYQYDKEKAAEALRIAEKIVMEVDNIVNQA